MTDADVGAIEARFGIQLPADYRRFLLAYPAELIATKKNLGWKQESPAERELYNNPARSIQYNEDARRPGTPWTPDDGPWPEHFFIIGDDQCGNYWCVDLDGAPGVWFYDHDTGDFEPVALSIEEFARDVLLEVRTWNAEQST